MLLESQLACYSSLIELTRTFCATRATALEAVVGWDGLHSLAAVPPYARQILAVVLVLSHSTTQMCELLHAAAP